LARGFSALLAVFEESQGLPEAVVASIRPMTSTRPRARIVSIGTAGVAAGWFYELWRATPPHVRKHSITADMNPRITPGYLERERLVMGDRRFRQEFMNEWATIGSGFFSAGAMAAFERAALPDLAEDDDATVVSRPAFRLYRGGQPAQPRPGPVLR
jgi:hypothetical protein